VIALRASDKIQVIVGDAKYREGEELDLIEASYLVYTGRAKAFDEDGKELDVKELFKRYARGDLWWILFTVFTDLASRGRRVRKGYGERDLVVEHGNNRYRVYVTEEGAEISMITLLSWIESSHHKDMIPVIAVVDMYGDVTYYQTSNINLRKIMD
jgi:tRNA splicing endonuclease